MWAKWRKHTIVQSGTREITQKRDTFLSLSSLAVWRYSRLAHWTAVWCECECRSVFRKCLPFSLCISHSRIWVSGKRAVPCRRHRFVQQMNAKCRRRRRRRRLLVVLLLPLLTSGSVGSHTSDVPMHSIILIAQRAHPFDAYTNISVIRKMVIFFYFKTNPIDRLLAEDNFLDVRIDFFFRYDTVKIIRHHYLFSNHLTLRNWICRAEKKNVKHSIKPEYRRSIVSAPVLIESVFFHRFSKIVLFDPCSLHLPYFVTGWL